MRQRLIVTAIVSLVLLNGALVFLLLEKMSDSRVKAEGTSTDLAPRNPAAAASEEPAVAAPGGPQGIAVAGDGAILRYFGGSCDGKVAAGMTISTDDGATFAEVDLPAGLRTIFALTAKNADDIDVVGGGEDCKAERHATTDGGARWGAAKQVDAWFLHAGTGKVSSPRGEVNPECKDVVTLGPVSQKRARLFCSSGALMGTADTGRTWIRLGALDGVTAGAFPTADLGYALAPDGGCQTRLFTSDDRGSTWTPSGCLAAQPGRALATNRDRLVAVAGDSVFVSEDGGRNWSKAS